MVILYFFAYLSVYTVLLEGIQRTECVFIITYKFGIYDFYIAVAI